MQCTRTITLSHNVGVLCYTYCFCPEHNINIIRDINLLPFIWGASIGVNDSLVFLTGIRIVYEIKINT